MQVPLYHTEEQTYLRLDISVVVVLQEQCGRLCVVFARGDVQSGQADLAFSVVLQQDGNHLVVALLERNGQRGEAILHFRGGGDDRDVKNNTLRKQLRNSQIRRVSLRQAWVN